jgi:hypothetical protein
MIFYQIILPPAIGIADNGDGAKIICRFNLSAPVQDPDDASFRYIHLRYTFAPEHHWDGGFWSSETLLFLLAMLVNRIFSKDGAFDIRCMGVIHALLFLLVFALLLSLLRRVRTAPRIILLALALLIFCDVTYSAYYNSFYMDAGAVLFLMLSTVSLAGAVLTGTHREADGWVALLYCLLLVTAKSQHAVLGLPLAVFLVWKRDSLWLRHQKLYSAAAFAVLIAGVTFSLKWATPSDYTPRPLFNMIFGRLLPSARNPRAELASLGLDESYLRYTGLNSYVPGSPMNRESFAIDFSHKTSYGRLGVFYATHPRRALKMLRLGLDDASWQRPPRLGNFDKSAGYPPFFLSRAFTLWSDAKAGIFRTCPWGYLVVFTLAAAVVTWRFRSGGVLLAAMGLLAVAVGSLGDSVDVTRHLFLFNAIWDLTFFAAVCALIPRICDSGE